jgi:hypothetical protein
MSDLKEEFRQSRTSCEPAECDPRLVPGLRRGARGEPDFNKGLEAIERNARVQMQLIEDLLT